MSKQTSFRELKIWKKAVELVKKVYSLAEKLSKEERFGLVDQIKRSSNSVAANIAEAQGRYHYADKIRILYQARGECFETQNHLSIALELRYITKREFQELDSEYEGLGVGINMFVNKLKTYKS